MISDAYQAYKLFWNFRNSLYVWKNGILKKQML